MIPKSIKSDDEKLSNELNKEWKSLQEDIAGIKQSDESKSLFVESACRTLWRIWNDEDMREAAGWSSWTDLFHEGNTELMELFGAIEDRIVLNSESNRNRLYNLLLIDSDPTISGEHLLRQKNWTRITQFESRITRLKQTMHLPDGEEKRAEAQKILAPTPAEKQDPDPADSNWTMKQTMGYWKGKPAIRVDNDDPLALKFKSRLTLVKAYYYLSKSSCQILATNDEQTKEVAQVLLPQNDPIYQEFINWMNSRLGVKIIS